ncbi:KpsF/GutQ family sugar-phosphate isomerase [Mailhella massiliensis]|uniref:KpsF/GutQ family sugar-phosphate isomerase n=1 Tax=Mailhella massiliensis TaxID=1903261 RepID=UPI00097DCCFF|nr:KpsF/GutQ family sugar-phosphate isomerase [Mailhella massiliensis]
MKYLDEARQVLRDEAQALCILADGLGESFENTVECLLGIKGRIAVTGMGKSGHVARKIAATLASTGSPAYFIHPAEASHGDLGMMTPDDAVIAISNSGNTAELTDIVLYASQNNMPLIAITKNADSFLGKHCDHLLLQPPLHEACPLDCAPTTSTTVQMALGDALAMCLLTARGFGREDFHKFHPGGSLGQKLSLVRDLMHTGDAMPLLQLEASMMSVLAEMTRKGFGCVGVMEGETLVGIITDGDLRRHMGPNILECSAGDLMTRNPVCIDADALSAKAQGIMEEKKITCVFVVDERKRPLGILSMHDIL